MNLGPSHSKAEADPLAPKFRPFTPAGKYFRGLGRWEKAGTVAAE